MNVVDFIKSVLQEEIQSIQADHKYLSFALIAGGIEFLGALCDRFDLKEAGHSEPRFRYAIQNFFPSEYHEFATKGAPFSLYSNLRCGLLHIIIPLDKLMLGEIANDSTKFEHLKKYPTMGNDRLFLMAENFYSDFRSACDKVVKIIEDKSILEFPEVKKASPKKREMLELKLELLTIE